MTNVERGLVGTHREGLTSATERGRWPDALIPLALLGLAVLLHLPALHQPVDRDVATYATIGQNLPRGLLPYRDLFDHKQPLVYAIFGLIHVLGGGVVAIRLLSAVVLGLAVAIAYRILAPRLGRPAAIVTSLLALVVGTSRYVEGVDLNTEHLLVLASVAAVLGPLAWQRSSWRPLPFIAGLFGGIAVLTKAVAVLFAPAAFLPLLAGRQHRRQSRASTVTAYLGGMAVPIVATAVLFLASGGFGDFLFANVTFNALYVGDRSFLGDTSLLRYLVIKRQLWPLAILVAVALASAVWYLWRRDRRDLTVWTTLVWLVGAGIGAKLGNRDFAHYFAPLVVPACILISLPFRDDGGKAGARTAAGILVLAVALPFMVDVTTMIGKSPDALFLRTYGIYGEKSENALLYEEIGTWLRNHGSPGSTLHVIGSEAGFYWQSGMRPATRYLYDHPLTNPRTAAALQPEVVAELCREPPDYLILPRGYQWPPYIRHVDLRRYRMQHEEGGVRVFRRQVMSPTAWGTGVERCPSEQVGRSEG